MDKIVSIVDHIEDSDIEFTTDWFLKEMADKEYTLPELINNCRQAMNGGDYKTLFIQSPIILRAITDTLARISNFPNAVHFKLMAILQLDSTFRLAFDQADQYLAGIENHIEPIRTYFSETKFEDSTDTLNWKGANLAYLDEIAMQMDTSGFDPYSVISLGHSGNRTGFALAASLGSLAYSIKYRKYDQGADQQVVILEGEDEALNHFMKGRKVLIYDEDTLNGEGLMIVRSVLQQFNPLEIKTATSLVTSHLYNGDIDFVGKVQTKEEINDQISNLPSQ